MVSLCNLINRPYQYFVLLFIMAMVYNLLLDPTFQVFCDPDGAATSTQLGTISGSTYRGATNTATVEGNHTHFNIVSLGGKLANKSTEINNTLCGDSGQAFWAKNLGNILDNCLKLTSNDAGIKNCHDNYNDNLKTYMESCHVNKK